MFRHMRRSLAGGVRIKIRRGRLLVFGAVLKRTGGRD